MISTQYTNVYFFHFASQYIKLLKTSGVQKWIFEENKKLDEITFLFKDKESPSSYVMTLASSMDVSYSVPVNLCINIII